jgi:hypothetical protein
MGGFLKFHFKSCNIQLKVNYSNKIVAQSDRHSRSRYQRLMIISENVHRIYSNGVHEKIATKYSLPTVIAIYNGNLLYFAVDL